MTGSIAFLPPADGTYTYRVSGQFYPEDLSNANPTNWLTEHRPWLLIKAVLMVMAQSLGAAQQARERLDDLQPDFMETKKDCIQQQLRARADTDGKVTI